MQSEEIGFRVKPSARYQARKKKQAAKTRSNTINLERVRKLSAIGMSCKSIARRLGISDAWFEQQKQKDFELEQAIILGQYEFEEGLRATQARLALSGHPGMLIWLGKQFLGQSDKQENKTETTVNVVLQNAMKELRELDANKLLEIKGIIEGESQEV